jgi:hypothetical protein
MPIGIDRYGNHMAINDNQNVDLTGIVVSIRMIRSTMFSPIDQPNLNSCGSMVAWKFLNFPFVGGR